MTPLNISIPDPPEISISLPEGNEEKSNYFNDITTVGIPTGIGLLVGGPIAAAVLGGASYFLNKTTTQAEKEAMTQNSQTPSTSVEFAQNYLTHFSEQVFLTHIPHIFCPIKDYGLEPCENSVGKQMNL